MTQKIQSILQTPDIPINYLNELLLGTITRISDLTGVEAVQSLYNAGLESFEFDENLGFQELIGAVNPNYTGPASMLALDPSSTLALGQELNERSNPTSNVGYTYMRRALDYRALISYEVGEWWREFTAMYNLARYEPAAGESLRDDAYIPKNLGYKEAFILACGDLTQAPFFLRMADDPDIDSLYAKVGAALIETGFIDHVGFDYGYSKSSVGKFSFPGKGIDVTMLTRPVVKEFYTHPYRFGCRNPHLYDELNQRFISRAVSDAGAPYTILHEGGASTVWPDDATNARGLFTDHSSMNDAGFDVATAIGFVADGSGTVSGRTGAAWTDAAGVAGRLNDADLILGVLRGQLTNDAAGITATEQGQMGFTAAATYGQCLGFGKWSRGGDGMTAVEGAWLARVDVKGSASATNGGHTGWNPFPVNLSIASPSNCFAFQMVEILRRMKRAFPSECEAILEQTGRLKRTLPKTSDHSGVAPYGHALSASIRDGWITCPTPAWNFTSKLTRSSHNGPTFHNNVGVSIADGGLPSGLVSPVVQDGHHQWGGLDDSAEIPVPNLVAGGSNGAANVHSRFTGLFQDGVMNKWSPAHMSNEIMSQGSSTEHSVRSDVLTWPYEFSSMGAPYQPMEYFDWADPSHANGLVGNGSEFRFQVTGSLPYVCHTHPKSGFMRGMVIRTLTSPTNGSHATLHAQTRSMPLYGPMWQCWKGTFMPATAWVDPWMPVPFSVTSAWLDASVYDTLPYRDVKLVGPNVGATQNYIENIQTQDGGDMRDISADGVHNYPSTSGEIGMWPRVFNTGANLDYKGAISGPAYRNLLDASGIAEDTEDNLEAGGQLVFGLRGIQNADDGTYQHAKHLNSLGYGAAGNVTTTNSGTSMIVGDQNMLAFCSHQLDGESIVPLPSDTDTTRVAVILGGSYMINPEFADITAYDVLPLAWFIQTYTGTIEYDVDPISWYGDATGYSASRIGPAFRLQGINPYDAMLYEVGVVDRVGSRATQTGAEQKITHSAWLEDGLADVMTVRRRKDLLGSVSPWNKDVGTEAGYTRINYEPTELQSQDDALRRSLMARSGALNAGLSNELFRKFQEVN